MRTFLAALWGLVWGRPAEKPGLATPGIATAVTDHSPSTAELGQERPSIYAANEKLIQHLDERDVSYLANGEGRSISADFRCDVGTYLVIAAVDEEGSVFHVFGYSPGRAAAP